MPILAFDSETSGLLDFRKDLMDRSQPRIVQLAAILYDDNFVKMDEMNLVAKPDGWTVHPEAAAVHGMTTEKCEEIGVPMPAILARFNQLKVQAQTRIGYNPTYDKRMLLREARIYDLAHDSSNITTIDVMALAKPVCKMPPTDKMMATGRKDFKAPKLGEAYEILIGKPMQGAHDAMSDVTAMMEIYLHILNKEAA